MPSLPVTASITVTLYAPVRTAPVRTSISCPSPFGTAAMYGNPSVGMLEMMTSFAESAAFRMRSRKARPLGVKPVGRMFCDANGWVVNGRAPGHIA